MTQNKRQHYRIIYRDKFPLLDCPLGKFTIVDLSERGIRFLVGKDLPNFGIGKTLEGKIILPEKRGEVKIKGRIHRILMSEVVLMLDEKSQIPLPVIMGEQRALIQKGKLSAS